MTIQRLSTNDLTQLATETPNAPMQIGAILRLAEPVAADVVRTLLRERVPRVPRLRQRLSSTPHGLGRPIWVDDEAFDPSRHIVEQPVDGAATEGSHLQVAETAVVARLPRSRPLWAATLVTDRAGRCSAVIVVLHHVLADGIGGLAALSELVDQDADGSPVEDFPHPAPTKFELLRDTVDSRLRTLRSASRSLAKTRAGVAELRGRREMSAPRTRPVRRTSLNRPIGPRRRLATVRVTLADTIAAAHRHGATVNDILLTAVAGALQATLCARGESTDTLVISVPVSARVADQRGDLGNQVGVTPVAVPVSGDPLHRLGLIAGVTETRAHVNGRGSSAAVLGLAFRALARGHAFAWFINHQRLVNTFVTNIRGPEERLRLAGRDVDDLIAVSPIAGNVTVAFAAISYAGTLTITIIADPERCRDIDVLVHALHRDLATLTSPNS